MATDWGKWTRDRTENLQSDLNHQREVLANPKASPAAKDKAASRAADVKDELDKYR